MTPTKQPFAPNRSIPDVTVIPVLHYADVPAAVAWLCRAFGFVERLRIGTHRVQLVTPEGRGAIVAADGAPGAVGHSVLVRVRSADAHFANAKAAGAEIIAAPVTHPYGERQYSARDPGGHAWTFSETVDDVDPRSWGGEPFSEDAGGDGARA